MYSSTEFTFSKSSHFLLTSLSIIDLVTCLSHCCSSLSVMISSWSKSSLSTMPLQIISSKNYLQIQISNSIFFLLSDLFFHPNDNRQNEYTLVVLYSLRAWEIWIFPLHLCPKTPRDRSPDCAPFCCHCPSPHSDLGRSVSLIKEELFYEYIL